MDFSPDPEGISRFTRMAYTNGDFRAIITASFSPSIKIDLVGWKSSDVDESIFSNLIDNSSSDYVVSKSIALNF